MRKKRSKRPFTLLEVMVVIGILASIGSIVGVRGKHLVDYYTFNSSVGKIASRCKLARHLAANYQTDVVVQIRKDGREVVVKLASDEPPLQKFPQFLDSLLLDGIVDMTFKDESTDELEVLFSGSGGVFPEGVLTIIGKKRSKEIPFLLSQP